MHLVNIYLPFMKLEWPRVLVWLLNLTALSALAAFVNHLILLSAVSELGAYSSRLAQVLPIWANLQGVLGGASIQVSVPFHRSAPGLCSHPSFLLHVCQQAKIYSHAFSCYYHADDTQLYVDDTPILKKQLKTQLFNINNNNILCTQKIQFFPICCLCATFLLVALCFQYLLPDLRYEPAWYLIFQLFRIKVTKMTKCKCKYFKERNLYYWAYFKWRLSS